MQKFTTRENRFRNRLRIPVEARRVLTVGECVRWDTLQHLTAEETYARYVAPILDDVLHVLERQPQRVFSCASLHYLKLYWERNWRKQPFIQTLVNDGRLRILGSALTSPDTNLTDDEALYHSYLAGLRWMRQQGFKQEPRAAAFPQAIAHSPGTPSLLAALGYHYASFSNLDGMPVPGADAVASSASPKPDSSAAHLLDDLASTEFTWRGPDGAKVVCHWEARPARRSDRLTRAALSGCAPALNAPLRWLGLTLPRLERFVDEVAAVSLTPYMFASLGCDFSRPVPELVELIAEYNATRYSSTGIWMRCGAVDEHLRLIREHRRDLPTLALDPNPSWMGLYASRPELKGRTRRLTRALLARERDVAISDGSEVVALWDTLSLSTGHDFVTGLATDRVIEAEVATRLSPVARALQGGIPDAPEEQSAEDSLPDEDPVIEEPVPFPVHWHRDGDIVEIATDHYRIRIDAHLGGSIVSWQTPSGREWIAGVAHDLVTYRDSGGLWRFGHEYTGGAYRESSRTSFYPANVEVEELDEQLEVTVTAQHDDVVQIRRMWFAPHTPVVRMQLDGMAHPRQTVTCRIESSTETGFLSMDVPGGVVTRSRYRGYDPTYWPASTFAAATGDHGTLAVLFAGPACVGSPGPGAIEWVVLRNAQREKAWGLFSLRAHPTGGTDGEFHRIDHAVVASDEPLSSAELHRHGVWTFDGAPLQPDWLEIDGDVEVTAIKRACFGSGTIVRLRAWEPCEVKLKRTDAAIVAATRCSALEWDREPLEVNQGVVTVPVERYAVTVRLLGEDDPGPPDFEGGG